MFWGEKQEDLAIGRFGDVRRDIRLSIVDCRWSIFLGFHHLIILK
jgi:hypothetical protein